MYTKSLSCGSSATTYECKDICSRAGRSACNWTTSRRSNFRALNLKSNNELGRGFSVYDDLVFSLVKISYDRIITCTHRKRQRTAISDQSTCIACICVRGKTTKSKWNYAYHCTSYRHICGICHVPPFSDQYVTLAARYRHEPPIFACMHPDNYELPYIQHKQSNNARLNYEFCYG